MLNYKETQLNASLLFENQANGFETIMLHFQILQKM